MHAQRHNDDQGNPYQHERNKNAGVKVKGKLWIPHFQEVLHEEGFRVAAPFLVERENHVPHRPGDNRGIVDGDNRANTHVPPTDKLGFAVEAAECQRGRCAPAVANRVVEEEEGEACGQQRHDVRDHEGAAAVLVSNSGETPNISQTNS